MRTRATKKRGGKSLPHVPQPQRSLPPRQMPLPARPVRPARQPRRLPRPK
ncbi:hypothetical protein ACFY05_10205 [Microtetraspora fusca]|uniref:Uncharacterized protein n=1 Tax=Microtetraspora fusca TaxID=1997 RepID=A0ABW6V2F7_MICFU